MLQTLLMKKLDSVERELGASVDYLRHILRISRRAFFAFARFIPLARYRHVLPPDPCHVARLVATRDEDCGSCVQIAVNLARKDGMSADLIAAVLERRPEDLPGPLADVYRFTEAVVEATGQDEAYRDRLRARYGEEGLVELAFAMATCRVFPITKRALGYAASCAQVEIRV